MEITHYDMNDKKDLIGKMLNDTYYLVKYGPIYLCSYKSEQRIQGIVVKELLDRLIEDKTIVESDDDIFGPIWVLNNCKENDELDMDGISDKAIFMGNGLNSLGQCYDTVTKLMDLFRYLNDVQQFGLRDEVISEKDKEDISEYKYEAKQFIRQLEIDLGLR